tara:strand:- start:5113 stop:5298 length:186 start_codon:yes stop_codon:yes gene_type:complete
MVMAYMIQTSDHYNERINEVEAQVMEVKESLEVLKYNITEMSDLLRYEADRLSSMLKEVSE